jgi:hypothetical protein
MSYKHLENAEKSVNSTLRQIHGAGKRMDWARLKQYVASRYPRIFRQFSRFDQDGFEMASKDPFDVWFSLAASTSRDKFGRETETNPEAINELFDTATRDVHSLMPNQRKQLVEHLVQGFLEEKTDRVFELVKESERSRASQTAIHDDVDRRVLQTADVIGITTTGLAKRISTLRHVECKVVICEEAGEVMEPHMISALLPSIEHFIQIGDHEQLRPQINNYKLSLESTSGAEYQLDRSQFERLSVGEPGRPVFPVAQLNIQRRMRPEISTLIRNTVYPRLTDHASTKGLPDVVGMRKNLFWCDHNNFEEDARKDMQQKSHSNAWEVEMVQALVRHIVRQGVYNSSDIAVLTPYTGQLQKLRAVMRSDFEIVLSDRDQETLALEGFIGKPLDSEDEEHGGQSGSKKKHTVKKQLSDLLRLATVDNFQGEEAKIIIVSLVRSNKERKVGFLRTNNRINVLLSRAQHGMYLIGNANTYSHIPMWEQVLGMLRATDSVGKAFGLCCPRHPETEIQASESDDFARLSPEGGCHLACSQRLATCGHQCKARCHSESMHQVFKCLQPCQRLHNPCNHGCQKQTCGENCGVCLVKLNNVLLPCSHLIDNISCFKTQDLSSVKCTTIVSKRAPRCNHIVEIRCSLDVSSTEFQCPAPCQSLLTCGHPCPGTCGQCFRFDDSGEAIVGHQPCGKICDRRFATCHHTCKRTCHKNTDCGQCVAPCEVQLVVNSCERTANIDRSVVSTLDVLYGVTNLVPHVLNAALGPASTEGIALCLALHRATAFPAPRGALKNCHADINVRQSVANYVPWTIVRCAPVNRNREWIFSR